MTVMINLIPGTAEKTVVTVSNTVLDCSYSQISTVTVKLVDRYLNYTTDITTLSYSLSGAVSWVDGTVVARFIAPVSGVATVLVKAGTTAGISTITITGVNIATTTVNVTIIDSVPQPPAGLSARKTSDGKPVLTWITNTEPDQSEYRLYRSSYVSGQKTYLNSVYKPANQYTDQNVSANVTYYYAITAVDANAQESVMSGSISVYTEPVPEGENVHLEDGISGEWDELTGVWARQLDGGSEAVYEQASSTISNVINLLSNRTYNDFAYYVRIKVLAGTESGVVFRVKNSSEGYKYVFNGSSVSLQTLSGITIGQPVNYTLISNQWYWLKVIANGNNKYLYVSTVVVNNAIPGKESFSPVLTETVNSSFGSGYIGLYTNNTAVMFDSIHIILTPTNLLLTPDNREITVSWKMSKTVNLDGFNIYSSTSGNVNNYKMISTTRTTGELDQTGAVVIRVKDEQLINYQTYYYMVSAILNEAEGDIVGPQSGCPYRTSTIKTSIQGRVTKKDKVTGINGVLCEAKLNNQVIVQVATQLADDGNGNYLTGLYSFSLSENTTYLICVTYTEGVKTTSVEQEILSGCYNMDFTLEINYSLGNIQGYLSNYKHSGNVSYKTLSTDSKLRKVLLQPGNNLGFVEVYNIGLGNRAMARIPVDESGKYELTNLLPGNYSVKAYNGHVYSSPETVKIEEGQTVSVNLTFSALPDNKVLVYPNPGTNNMTFAFYTTLAEPMTRKILVYTVIGDLVREVGTGLIGNTSGNCSYVWDCTNSAGDKLASGVYLYMITVEENATGKKEKVVKKLAIIR
jgi:fibronectin type 3 domain-containing protein